VEGGAAPVLAGGGVEPANTRKPQDNWASLQLLWPAAGLRSATQGTLY
jgi:hypothetical protein